MDSFTFSQSTIDVLVTISTIYKEIGKELQKVVLTSFGEDLIFEVCERVTPSHLGMMNLYFI